MSSIITVKTDSKKTEYPILIGANAFDPAVWLPKKSFSKIVLITDNNVKEYYGVNLQKQLNKAGHSSVLLSFPPGEKYKTAATKQKIENSMLKLRCDRDSIIIALGGGVVGDVAGFIAATYLRGISYVQIPTTLLAMIDSSVGGKTAINNSHGKNLIGAIYQPAKVITDISFLKTLSKEQTINGLVEAIKMFLTHDKQSLHFTEKHLDSIINGNQTYIKKILARAIKIKANVVARDENEQGERSVLNFGHTIGHALEKITNYKMLHGYAVAYGILVEANISRLLGYLDETQMNKIKNIMARIGICGSILKKFNLTKIIQATRNDKKAKLNTTHYVLLNQIGQAHVDKLKFTHAVSDAIVAKAFKNTIHEAENGR